jgi:hypothetical protein
LKPTEAANKRPVRARNALPIGLLSTNTRASRAVFRILKKSWIGAASTISFKNFARETIKLPKAGNALVISSAISPIIGTASLSLSRNFPKHRLLQFLVFL